MSTRDSHSKPGPVGGDRPPLPSCPDGDALVTYLYDEFEPGSILDRRQVSLHVRECQVCAAELEALGGVRAQLPAWVAPDMDAGFRLIQEPARAAGWRNAFGFLQSGWLRPAIPYAAAALVLGTALAFARLDVQYGAGGLQVRTGWGHSATQATAVQAPASARIDSMAGMRAEIESLREELRRAQSLMAAGRGLAATSLAATSTASGTAGAPLSVVAVSAPAGDAALMRRLRQLVDESEMRQQQNLQLRISEIARDFKLLRQADMVQVEQGFSRLAGQRQQDAADRLRLMDALRNVSLQSKPPQ